MAIVTWDGQISSVCEKVGFLGGRNDSGRCSNWKNQSGYRANLPARLVWSQSDNVAFARSYMPAAQLLSGGAPTTARPRFYLFSGSQASTILLGNERELRLDPGQIVLLKMDQVLRWSIERPYVASSVIISEALLDDACPNYKALLGQPLDHPFGLERPLDELMRASAQALESDCFEGSGDQLAQAMLRIITLAKPVVEATDFATGRRSVDVRCDQIKGYIERNYSDPNLSIGSIAKRFGLSARYVQIAFATLKTTPSDFIRQMRIREAARMLSDQRYKGRAITEIAFACGFNSSAYFSTEFRRVMHLSPRAFRALPHEWLPQ